MYPSLFNDVFGPIMIGPSSSACAGPTRIGQIAHDVAGGVPRRLQICYVPGSGRAAMSVGLGTNLGLIAGVLGWDTEDARLYTAYEAAAAQGMEVEVVCRDIPGNDNPNAILLTMTGADGAVNTLLGDSVGGGTIDIMAVDGIPVCGIKGEEYVLLVTSGGPVPELPAHIPQKHLLHMGTSEAAGKLLTMVFLEEQLENLSAIMALPGVLGVRQLTPIMPIVTRRDASPPLFTSVGEMVALAEREGVDCSEVAIRYEMGRSGWSRERVFENMRRIWHIILGTVEKGESGTVRHMRGPLHPLFAENIKHRAECGACITDEVTTRTLATAIYAHEGKNDLHTLSVAGPAAGCPPIMAGALKPLQEKFGKTEDDVVHALFTAAAIGAVTYMKTVPTGEITGCSGEVGVGSAMAAGAIITLVGGTPRQVDTAAAIALMNMFGLPCDPIAGGGCAMPCRGRSHTAPLNSQASAELALCGFDNVVPYDQVVEAMDSLYAQLPGCMKGNLSGGIPATPAAQKATAVFTAWARSAFL
jgi:L-serine dehydratase